MGHPIIFFSTEDNKFKSFLKRILYYLEFATYHMRDLEQWMSKNNFVLAAMCILFIKKVIRNLQYALFNILVWGLGRIPSKTDEKNVA